jgi:hypothetical protein
MLPSNNSIVGSEAHHAIAGFSVSATSEGLVMVKVPRCPWEFEVVPLAVSQPLFVIFPVNVTVDAGVQM